MMKTNKTMLIIKLAMVAIMLIVGFYFFDKLPEQIPVHRNYLGQADDYGSKRQGLLMLPVINLLLILLMTFLPMNMPKFQTSQVNSKAWEIMQLGIIGFFMYIYFVSIYATLNPDISINKFMRIGLGAFFVLLGNYLGKIRQNYWVGIKVPWTYLSEEVRDQTNRLGGRIFVGGGIIFVLWGIFGLTETILSVWVFLLVILSIIFVPIVYSYILYKKIQK